jgi:hypothetical protein
MKSTAKYATLIKNEELLECRLCYDPGHTGFTSIATKQPNRRTSMLIVTNKQQSSGLHLSLLHQASAFPHVNCGQFNSW